MITIYVIDPFFMFRKGICVALAGDKNIDIIGDTGDIREAQSFLQVHSPDIVILNSGGRGLEMLKRIRQKRPNVRVILILGNEYDEHLLSAMKSGASAIFSREISKESFLSLVREVAEGGTPIGQPVSRQFVAARLFSTPGNSSCESERERRPSDLTASGSGIFT